MLKNKIENIKNEVVGTIAAQKMDKANKKLEYFTKTCSKCKEEFRTKHITKAYCIACYSSLQREYRADFKDRYDGYYLYRIADYLDFTLYAGSTINYKNRLYNHTHYHTHLKEQMCSDSWEYIEYIDLTDKLNSLLELKFLENYLMYTLEPEWNKCYNIIKEEDLAESRKTELIDILNSSRWNFYRENGHKKSLY